MSTVARRGRLGVSFGLIAIAFTGYVLCLTGRISSADTGRVVVYDALLSHRVSEY